MAQFDVYRNPDSSLVARIPYLLDIQTSFLDQFDTRVVAPLMRHEKIVAARRLHPNFTIEGAAVVMVTTDIAAIRRSQLGDYVASLATHRDEIIAAIDFLITGI